MPAASGTMGQVREEMARRVQANAEELVSAELFLGRFDELYRDDQLVKKIYPRSEVTMFQVGRDQRLSVHG